jgi:hypothetical protein
MKNSADVGGLSIFERVMTLTPGGRSEVGCVRNSDSFQSTMKIACAND